MSTLEQKMAALSGGHTINTKELKDMPDRPGAGPTSARQPTERPGLYAKVSNG